MQLAGPGVFGPPKDRNAALAVLARRSRGGSTTSTPAITTVLTLPTSSFARRFNPIPMLHFGHFTFVASCSLMVSVRSNDSAIPPFLFHHTSIARRGLQHAHAVVFGVNE